MIQDYNTTMQNVVMEIKKAINGKDEIIEKILLALLARGNVLMDDIPGVGKTTLALAFSKSLSLNYSRMQFTPDVLPSDVVGFNLFNKEKGEFEFKPGAAVCNLFLADEINRTSSKTQAALLEVMEEKQATVDGVTRKMPEPYMVIATQNPVGSAGTQMLPESQLDRFIVRLSMGYPDASGEASILKNRSGKNPLDDVQPCMNMEDIVRMQNETDTVFVHDEIYDYIVRLANATRTHELIKLGISPRGSLALTRMAKAHAYLYRRNYVMPDDVMAVFESTVAHRLIISPKAKVTSVSAEAIIAEILKNTEVPQISGRPDGK